MIISIFFFFFFNDTATTEIYTLSLHDALPISIVFVDEVHRFNKAQQDAFLPHVEAGHITFIGATTENPSFEVISPLLSRTKVYILEPLTTPQIVELLRRALADKARGLLAVPGRGNEPTEVSDDILFRIASFANGDARAAYNTLDRKSTRLNSSHGYISYAVFCLKKKKKKIHVSDHNNAQVTLDLY